MKKRLLSLLLAVAMMVAMVPTAAFAGDEAGIASSKTLSITADGKPDVTGIAPTTDNGKKVYAGYGWKYEVHPNADYLSLQGTFDLSSQPAVTCSHVENYGEIQGGVFDPCDWESSYLGVHSGYVENFGTISGGIYNGAVRFAKSDGQTSNPEIKGGIFCGDVVYGSSPNNPYDPDDTSHTTFGTISGGIFVNDPGVSKYTISVLNGKIKEVSVGNTKAEPNSETLYVVGVPPYAVNLALDDGTPYSLGTHIFQYHGNGGGVEFTKHIPLTITSAGVPDTTGMTEIGSGKYKSTDWSYESTSDETNQPTLTLEYQFTDSVGTSTAPVQIYVDNSGWISGGTFGEHSILHSERSVENIVCYGKIYTSSISTPYYSFTPIIKNSILLNPPSIKSGDPALIENCIIVNDPDTSDKLTITATDGAKITTIQLGDLTMTLDEPVSEIYFLPANSDSAPKKLTVTLDDGTEYENIDLEQTVITLAPTKRDDPTTYYSVTVEGGEARNERGDILDSEVALTAGEKITLKLLDETQGEMAFSHWDVNNGDTDLADELAKTGFDKTAHETTFTMPAHNLTLTAKYRMPDEDAPQDDSFLMTAAAVTGGAVLTGLVVWQGYNIFSQVYLNAHLPEGTAIPTNRQQLALLLWNTAGQPEASAASYVFPDVADPDVQTAARWATEQGLFKARKDGTFAPTDSVTTGQVYRAWQKVKTAG